MKNAWFAACIFLLATAVGFAQTPVQTPAAPASLPAAADVCSLQLDGVLFAAKPQVKALCFAEANCESGTVSCSGEASSTSCSAVDRSCPGERGHVTCDGVTTYCPTVCTCSGTPIQIFCCLCAQRGDCFSCCRCSGGTLTQCSFSCS
jgi:hypothetical protein